MGAHAVGSGGLAGIDGRMLGHGAPRPSGHNWRRRVYHEAGASGQAKREGKWMQISADEGRIVTLCQNQSVQFAARKPLTPW